VPCAFTFGKDQRVHSHSCVLPAVEPGSNPDTGTISAEQTIVQPFSNAMLLTAVSIWPIVDVGDQTMLKPFVLFVATCTIVSLAGVSAYANRTPCGARGMIVDRLQEKYQEVPRAKGLGNATQIVEIWASVETGTFTILITDPTGKSCIAATGANWLEGLESPEKAGIAG